MFGIDFEELLVIAVLALILFGPEKLPEYAEKLGRIVAKLRMASSEFSQHYHKLTNPELTDLTTNFNESLCPQCKQFVSGEFTFCPSCGHRLKGQVEGPGTDQPLAS